METISNINNQKSKILLIFIFLLGFGLRIYGLNWDEGRHFHPDERALIMVADKVHLFDQMNPDFFNYGSLPIYLLKGTAQVFDWYLGTPVYANYDGLLVIGRWLSVFFDMITLFFVYKLATELFDKKTLPLFATFFYAVMFFPIQNSHFFVVDVFLTTLTTGLIFTILLFVKKQFFHQQKLIGVNKNYMLLIITGLIYGAMLGTKASSLVFLPVILFAVNTPYIIKIIKKRLVKIHRDLLRLFVANVIFILTAFISFAIAMPYALIEWDRFLRDVSAQIAMNSDPYIFPYTLQYVGTTPYLYYLKNMFLWGVGPFISILAIIGFIRVVIYFFNLTRLTVLNINLQISKLPFKFKKLSKKNNRGLKSNIQLLTLFFLFFYFFYFLILGKSAVKFMRYMLPLYPFIAILAGYGILHIIQIFKRTIFYNYVIIGYLLLVIGYSAMFVNMYSYRNTRISATEWMLRNLSSGAIVGVEHWDDRVPVHSGEKFQYEELPLYDLPDDENKWLVIREKIKKIDYIVLASNRLYVPLQRLTDCSRYKKCYPLTAEYYQNLFSGRLGFIKIADFHVYPTIPFSEMLFNRPIGINDQGADESFTVYDHPRVIIFGKKSEDV